MAISLAAFALALGWLLPVHNAPWTMFFQDAWITGCGLLICGGGYIQSRVIPPFEFGKLECLCIAIFLFQWSRFAIFDESFGVTWIAFAYSFVFFAALYFGRAFEKDGLILFDAVWMALVIAGVASVILQFLGVFRISLDPSFFWAPSGARFSANLGQPNLLGSIFLLAICGAAWLFQRRKVAAWGLGLLVAIMLIGLGLTQSRTGYLNFVWLSLYLGWYWKHLRPPLLWWGIVFIWIGFVVWVTWGVPSLLEYYDWVRAERQLYYDSPRLQLWSALASVAMEKPWSGYGWGLISHAYLSVHTIPFAFEGQGVVSHSHNLVLDFLLYNGFLVAALLLIVFLSFFREVIGKAVQDWRAGLVLGGVGVLIVHSMLEPVMQYASFLFVFGLFCGFLSNFSTGYVFNFGRRYAWCLVLASAIVWSVSVRDALELERTWGVIRYKDSHLIKDDEVPDFWVLSQYRDRFDFMNLRTKELIELRSLGWMEGVVKTTPSPYAIFKLANIYAEIGNHQKSFYWLGLLCKFTVPEQRQKLKESWDNLDEKFKYSSDAHSRWPGCDG